MKFYVNDMVMFGEGWSYTGEVRRAMPKKDGKVTYVVKYFIGREPRFVEKKPEQLKLRMREV